jgi:hypothetical protein
MDLQQNQKRCALKPRFLSGFAVEAGEQRNLRRIGPCDPMTHDEFLSPGPKTGPRRGRMTKGAVDPHKSFTRSSLEGIRKWL